MVTQTKQPDTDIESFDWRTYLLEELPELPTLVRRATDPDLDAELRSKYAAAVSKLLVARTRDDPLLFALVYLRRHLQSKETGDRVSLSEFHLQLCEEAAAWVDVSPEPMQHRTAWVAPRGSGKSTWLFLILPLWALAHGHRRFVAAFADSGHQAEQHLSSFKRELDTNTVLRRDFPKLCTPAVRPSGTTVADNRGLYTSAAGVSFQARGIDASTLGAKIEDQRPDLLLFDDIEPDEANYSGYQKDKRLGTVINAVFPMNDHAIVVFSGTVVMPGSIMHDLARQALDNPDNDQLPSWPAEEQIRTRYFPALYHDDDGQPQSLWPERWSVQHLLSIRHTRSFTLNMQNDPRGQDGAYWGKDDYRYGEPPGVTKIFVWVDPPTTTKKTSDPAGVAVVGWAPPRREPGTAEWRPAQVVVYRAWEVRKTGAPLAEHVAQQIPRISQQIGRPITGALIEANNGGDLWAEVFDGRLGVPVHLFVSSEGKDTRFARTLEHYQRGQVWHAEPLPILEQQQVSYPRAAHDDVVDAASAGVLHFLEPKPARRRAETVYPG